MFVLSLGFYITPALLGGGKVLMFEHGKVGMGYGKAREVPLAIQKGTEEAKKNLFEVPLAGSTITHPILRAIGQDRPVGDHHRPRG